MEKWGSAQKVGSRTPGTFSNSSTAHESPLGFKNHLSHSIIPRVSHTQIIQVTHKLFESFTSYSRSNFASILLSSLHVLLGDVKPVHGSRVIWESLAKNSKSFYLTCLHCSSPTDNVCHDDSFEVWRVVERSNWTRFEVLKSWISNSDWFICQEWKLSASSRGSSSSSTGDRSSGISSCGGSNHISCSRETARAVIWHIAIWRQKFDTHRQRFLSMNCCQRKSQVFTVYQPGLFAVHNISSTI